jgi:hypothetical protein
MEIAGGFRARAFGFVLLAVILATVVLLIAGYGVAVRLGALVGLILGTIAGVASSLWLVHGPGGSWLSSASQPSADAMAVMQELGEMAELDLGAVLAIQPVLETVAVAGLTVELLAIEHHVAGLALSLDVRPATGALPPPWFARVTVRDDVGTAYRASGQGSGGSPGSRRYDVRVLPAPPATAARLEISVDRFLDPMGGGRHTPAGPWAFSVPISSRPQ